MNELSWCLTLSWRQRKVHLLLELLSLYILQETVLKISNPQKVLNETQTAQQWLPWQHIKKKKRSSRWWRNDGSRRVGSVTKAPPPTSRQSAMKCTNETGKAPLLTGSPSMWPSCGGGGQTRRYGWWRRVGGGETWRRRWFNSMCI